MTTKLLVRLNKMSNEINELKIQLDHWKESEDLSVMKLYKGDSSFYIDVNVFMKVINFKELKSMVIEKLEAKISKLQKELDEL